MGTFMSTPIEATISRLQLLNNQLIEIQIEISTSIVFNNGIDSLVLRKVHMTE